MKYRNCSAPKSDRVHKIYFIAVLDSSPYPYCLNGQYCLTLLNAYQEWTGTLMVLCSTGARWAGASLIDAEEKRSVGNRPEMICALWVLLRRRAKAVAAAKAQPKTTVDWTQEPQDATTDLAITDCINLIKPLLTRSPCHLTAVHLLGIEGNAKTRIGRTYGSKAKSPPCRSLCKSSRLASHKDEKPHFRRRHLS